MLIPAYMYMRYEGLIYKIDFIKSTIIHIEIAIMRFSPKFMKSIKVISEKLFSKLRPHQHI